MENILEKLRKNDISQDRYIHQKKELLDLGFSEDQLNKIIVKKYSNNTVNTLINQFHKVVDSLTHEDITVICSKDGGGKHY